MNTMVTTFFKKRFKNKVTRIFFEEQFKLVVLLIKFLESHFFSCTNVSFKKIYMKHTSH